MVSHNRSEERPPVACIGGLSRDRKIRTDGPLRRGTSNPVRGRSAPGGVARNVAECLARLGCPVSLFSIAGRDADGDVLIEALRAAGVDVSGVERSASSATARYTAVLEPDGGLAYGFADMEILDELGPAWAERAASRIAEFPVWFVDANIPGATLEALLGGVPGDVTVLADPVSVAKSERLRPVLGAVSVLFPDRGELGALSGLPAGTQAEAGRAARRLRESGVGTIVASLGADGVHVEAEGRSETIPPIPPDRLVDVTGAGDALIAGYALGLVTEAADPLGLGLAAASLVLATDGSAAEVVTELRVRERLATRDPAPSRAGRTTS